VQASGVKGAIRAHARDLSAQETPPLTNQEINLVFGPEQGASEYAGSLAFTDARLLLFPVRSLAGVFAWTTCPTVLQRLRRDLAVARTDLLDIPTPESNQAFVTQQPGVLVDQSVVLEEFTFAARPNQAVSDLASWLANHALPRTSEHREYRFWADQLTKNLVVLPDDAVISSSFPQMS
jgi:CRISPR-associated protein Cmr4